ncbi:hypothetical protein D5086_009691 [Populus alba]|uniref:Uncharacterized protein n=1 Tax=Populus alba TaxID=43335 RepID=A0ACC4C808_POPAL
MKLNLMYTVCRVEIRVHFHYVPENLYCKHFKVNIDLATNELILSDAPNEAILLEAAYKGSRCFYPTTLWLFSSLYSRPNRLSALLR